MVTAMTQSDDPLDKQMGDAVQACRRVMIDLTVEEKAVVLQELRRWLVAEVATNDTAAAKERQH